MNIAGILLIGLVLVSEDFKVAKKAYDEGSYETAIAGFEQILEKKGEETKDALFYLTLSYYKSQRWIDAGFYFSKFCESFSGDERITEAVDKGIESYLLSHRAGAAFELFKKFPYISLPLELGYSLGKALEENQEFEKAYYVYSALKSEEASLLGIDALLKAKKIDKAKELLLSFASEDTSRADRAYFKVFYLSLNRGDTLSAIEVLPKIRNEKKLKPEEALYLTEFLIWRRDFKTAEECLNIAENDSSCRYPALKELVLVYRNLRDYQKEEKVLEALEPSEWVGRELSRVRFFLGKEFDKTLIPDWDFLDPEEFKQTVLKLYDEGYYQETFGLLSSVVYSFPWMYLLKGRLYEKVKDYSSSIESYNKFIGTELMGEEVEKAKERIGYLENYYLTDYERATEELLNCQTSEEKGRVLFRFTKDYKKAANYLKDAKTDEGLYYLGLSYELLYRETKNPQLLEESQKAYKDLIIRFPESPLFEAAGFRKAALTDEISEYEKFLAFHPKSSFSDTALFRVGMKYLNLGDTTKAKDKLEKIEREFSRSPLYPSAVFAITRLDTTKIRRRLSSLVSLPLKDSVAYLSLRSLYQYAVSSEEYRKAIRFLEDMFKRFLYPRLEDIRAYTHLLINTGALKKALKFLNNQSSNKEIDLLRAEVLAAMGREREAILLLYSFYPEDYKSEYLYLRADLAKRLDKIELAKESLEKLLRVPLKDSFFIKGEMIMGEVYLNEGDFTRAWPIYQDLYQREGSIKYLSLLISSLYKAGELLAGDSLLMIYEEKTQTPGTHLSISKLRYLLDSNKIEEGEREISRITATDPLSKDNLEFTYYDGLVDFKKGDFDKAIEKFSRFLDRFKPNRFSPLVNFKLATSYYEKGYWEKALEFYKKASRDSSLRRDALSNMAVIYKQKKKWDRTISIYEELLKETTDLKFKREIEFKMGYTHLQKKDFATALDIFRELRNKVGDPDIRCEITYWIGEAYFGLGLFAAATFEFLKIPYLCPKNELWKITSELRAGMCYEQLNRKDKAREIYKRIIAERGIDDGWAKEAQERLDALK